LGRVECRRLSSQLPVRTISRESGITAPSPELCTRCNLGFLLFSLPHHKLLDTHNCTNTCTSSSKGYQFFTINSNNVSLTLLFRAICLASMFSRKHSIKVYSFKIPNSGRLEMSSDHAKSSIPSPGNASGL
jgi:hypothetical protein